MVSEYHSVEDFGFNFVVSRSRWLLARCLILDVGSIWVLWRHAESKTVTHHQYQALHACAMNSHESVRWSIQTRPKVRAARLCLEFVSRKGKARGPHQRLSLLFLLAHIHSHGRFVGRELYLFILFGFKKPEQR